ncbi:ribonuclease H [Candidatus Pacearchaeota archaeon]|nr:ribonuclease H [Candidatus Pacearchaeota archaeon]|tara:strand:+ start:2978 stop:3406 length:429 start_codon:yes stop_codon:yes gene_type:complete
MIYTSSDGGCRGNPGPGAIGVLVRKDKTILTKYSAFIGRQITNNIAEYEALIKALEMASKFGKKITCCLDSELVVNQLFGKYKVKNPRLLPLFLKVQKLQENFDLIRYRYVRRENYYQRIADELLNRELTKRGFYKKKFVKG